MENIDIDEEHSDGDNNKPDTVKHDLGGEQQARLFSSEDFKIEVNNLPKFCGHAQLKKLFGQNLKLFEVI